MNIFYGESVEKGKNVWNQVLIESNNSRLEGEEQILSLLGMIREVGGSQECVVSWKLRKEKQEGSPNEWHQI